MNPLDNLYETFFILKPDLTEETTLNIIKKYQQMLITNGCRDILIYDRGRRHLSYPIQKYQDGIYIECSYVANKQIVSNLEKFFRIDDTVIRYLTIKTNSSFLVLEKQ
uniref:ribosomal protein S6 n=1 Tax=Chroothece richteriana TaxID=101928 RepID=UPI001FCDAC8A|nr:ribosomal protein S6 [Chroothece richteriana]UNJ14226.1 ribosomal protein S6 [Chroothece richteriana]